MTLPISTDHARQLARASIVVLKIVAWLDRPSERTRDLADLATVFRDALGEDDDRRWDQGHPVATSELDFDDQSPFFVGLEVGAITSPHHQARIDAFIDRLLRKDGRDAASMARAARLLGEEPRGDGALRCRLVRVPRQCGNKRSLGSRATLPAWYLP